MSSLHHFKMAGNTSGIIIKVVEMLRSELLWSLSGTFLSLVAMLLPHSN